jgi:hypothetical protein
MQSGDNSFIVPSAGVSAIGVMGIYGDGGTAIGSNVGVAIASRNGMRLGVTWHRFDGEEGVVLLEMGVGRIR